MPEGEWSICVNAEKAGTEVLGTASGTVEVDAISEMILVQGKTVDDGTVGGNTNPVAPNQSVQTGDNTGIAIMVLMVLACASVLVIVRKRKFN